jgi:hypothetical protein
MKVESSPAAARVALQTFEKWQAADGDQLRHTARTLEAPSCTSLGPVSDLPDAAAYCGMVRTVGGLQPGHNKANLNHPLHR